MLVRLRTFVLLSVLALTPSRLLAQQTIKICTETAEDRRFQLAGTFGFSVSSPFGTSLYRLFATGALSRLKWDAAGTCIVDALWARNPSDPARPLCDFTRPPDQWDPRCSIDGVHLFSKPMASEDDLWDAHPGRANIDTVPSAIQAPIWPRSDDFGVTGHTPLITKEQINSAFPDPAPTTLEDVCHPHNPTSLATAASNPKAVQVFYPEGESRWFMAFNENINHTLDEPDSRVCDLVSPCAPAEQLSHLPVCPTNQDNWRVLWARSKDGESWTVDDTLLFRGISETQFCSGGLLVTDLFSDDGHFYIVLTEIGAGGTAHVYLARSFVDPRATSRPGYLDAWYLATDPIVGGEYTWTRIPRTKLGALLDPAALNAVSILPTRSWPWRGLIKQTAIARVFDSAALCSRSRYLAISADVDASGNRTLQLWSTPSLTRPFAFESVIDPAGIQPGIFGWEHGFTHYADNLPGCGGPGQPRLVREGLDFWFVAREPGGVAVSRRQAQVSPFISAPSAVVSGTFGLVASVEPRAGSRYSWTVEGGRLTGGQGSSAITYRAGPAGTTMAIRVVETTSSGCGDPEPDLALTTTRKVQVNFRDVPSSHPYHAAITTVARHGITPGCGGGRYCPAVAVRRDEMAVYLLRGKHGGTYQPPAAAHLFSDESQTPLAAWTEQISEGVALGPPPGGPPCDPREAIVTACSPVAEVNPSCVVTRQGRYCPKERVTRSSMAAFLLRARHGTDFRPPACTGLFTDVACSHPDARWIEQLYREGITAGCGGTNYCPNRPVTRGEMASFIVRTFRLR